MNSKRRTLGVLAAAARLLGALVDRWPLAVLALLLLSPEGPHLRWAYQYRDVYSERAYTRCTYLGSRGFVTPVHDGNCPVIIWINARDYK